MHSNHFGSLHCSSPHLSILSAFSPFPLFLALFHFSLFRINFLCSKYTLNQSSNRSKRKRNVQNDLNESGAYLYRKDRKKRQRLSSSTSVGDSKPPPRSSTEDNSSCGSVTATGAPQEEVEVMESEYSEEKPSISVHRGWARFKRISSQ